ncbi:hypothetical protein GCM10009760_20220 [Kitasatospora kazusensis]|uniref:Secreted protein n=1 Tax=Kitasatospora kazusensis TaxID=407974 RepID=A0ABP5KXC8_9ACTN
MGEAASAIIASAVMLSSTILVVFGLLWHSTTRSRGELAGQPVPLAQLAPPHQPCERAAAGQEQLRAEPLVSRLRTYRAGSLSARRASGAPGGCAPW